MHTSQSLPVEVAASKLAAARAVAAEALEAIAAGELRYAADRIDKAGGKLVAASMALAEQHRRQTGGGGS